MERREPQRSGAFPLQLCHNQSECWARDRLVFLLDLKVKILVPLAAHSVSSGLCFVHFFFYRKHISLYALQLFDLNWSKLVSELLIEPNLFFLQWLMLKSHPVLKRRAWKTKSSLSPSSLTRYCISSAHVRLQTQIACRSNHQPKAALFFLQGKMDRTLAMLQNADPADPSPDSPELIQLEGININAGVNLVALPMTTAVGLSYTVVF